MMRATRFCKHGHDKEVVGVYSNRDCKQCVRDRTAAYAPEKMAAYRRAYRHRNKEAWRQSTKDWKMRNPEAKAASQKRTRLARYGLTVESFNSLIAAQNGSCAICGAALIIGGRGGCKIDHCHKTGVVRGILCSACNTGIGHLKDDTNILRAAIAYLQHLGAEGEIGIV